MSLLSIPIRKYSYYTLTEPAPSGFSTGKAPTLVDRWSHVVSDGRISMIISTSKEGSLVLKVVMQPYNQELEVVDFFKLRETFMELNHEPFQFSAKAPSISCKYLIQKDDMICIRRFQLGFHNGVDFIQAREILQKMGFAIKPAVSTRSSTVVPPTQSFFYSQNQPMSFSRNHNNKVTISTDQGRMNYSQWNNSQPNVFTPNSNLDFILSQSTPLPAPKVTKFNEMIQHGIITQQTPEPSIENLTSKENLVSNIAPLIVGETPSGPDAKSIEIPSLDQIKEKLKDPAFIDWVCYKLLDNYLL